MSFHLILLPPVTEVLVRFLSLKDIHALTRTSETTRQAVRRARKTIERKFLNWTYNGKVERKMFDLISQEIISYEALIKKESLRFSLDVNVCARSLYVMNTIADYWRELPEDQLANKSFSIENLDTFIHEECRGCYSRLNTLMSKLAPLSVLMRHMTLSSRELGFFHPINDKEPPTRQRWYHKLLSSETFGNMVQGREREVRTSVSGVVVHRGYPQFLGQGKNGEGCNDQIKPKPSFWMF